MAVKPVPNQKDPNSGLLGNDPASSQQDPQGQQQASGGGQQGLSEADVRRIATEVAKPAAQSEAYKAENRMNQNVRSQGDQIQNIIKVLQRQNPNLKLGGLSEEQIRNAQREMVMNDVADRMLGGNVPGAPAGSTQQPPQGVGGGQQGSGPTVNTEYLRIRLEEVFYEEGETLYGEDPETKNLPDPNTVTTGQMIGEIRKAVQEKKQRLLTNPQARIPSQASGANVGGLVSQYQQEKAKLPRGQARAKQLQELRMKYQKMGAPANQLV